MPLHPNTLRNASTKVTPGTDASIANIAAKGAGRRKKNVIRKGMDAVSSRVDMFIRKRILGDSEVTGKS